MKINNSAKRPAAEPLIVMEYQENNEKPAVTRKEPIDLRKIISDISGLSEAEEIIRSSLISEAELLCEVPSYLFKLGGKRIRPVLTLLVARALKINTPPRPLLEVSAGIELIHMATLLHDDIIDNSKKRRNSESPYKRYGLASTLLSGDFLLVRAFSLCANLDKEIIAATEKACVELTEGEILETPLFSEQHSLESYLTIARKKTASLFRLAAFSGAHLSTGNQNLVRLFSEFGEQIGIAFQMLDDILDVVSDENLLGKERGIDLQESKPSLVNVLWLNSGDPLATELLKKPDQRPANFKELAIAAIENSRVIEQARRYALDYADRASKTIEKISERYSEETEAAELFKLLALVNFTVSRLN
ncbi:MAG: polyprenyl synthetase family protein [Candidatus Dadabacteria bacterium]|nr:MAG: polyprenyl synthetase family protein [Candidatus Dadabacteria bacterium]